MDQNQQKINKNKNIGFMEEERFYEEAKVFKIAEESIGPKMRFPKD